MPRTSTGTGPGPGTGTLEEDEMYGYHSMSHPRPKQRVPSESSTGKFFKGERVKVRVSQGPGWG
jgi:hypothetical protein